MEGSHLAHFLLPATDETILITINPADRFNNVFADYAGVLGGRHGTVVAEIDGPGYRVDIDHLMRFIERLERAPTRDRSA